MTLRCFILGCKESTVVIPATDTNEEWKFTSCSRCKIGYLTDKTGRNYPTTVVPHSNMRGDSDECA